MPSPSHLNVLYAFLKAWSKMPQKHYIVNFLLSPMATLPSRRISITINVSSSKVYSFASNPLNLPKWASGLSGSIKKVKGKWVADSPMGKFTITFAPKNQFGILDHLVDFKGKTFQNPMRVIP